jgi:type I restriction enzyme R subunit
MKELLLGILKAYETDGEAELAGKKLGQFLTARYGSVSEGKAKLGELHSIRDAFNKMQSGLYAD